jgi:putative toxin-antitoxin system antitoxin component (TIGR02293 family)
MGAIRLARSSRHWFCGLMDDYFFVDACVVDDESVGCVHKAFAFFAKWRIFLGKMAYLYMEALMVETQALDLVLHWTHTGLHMQALKVSVSPQVETYGESVGVTSQDKHDMIRMIKKGLPFVAFDKLQKGMGVSVKTLVKVLNIADRTLTRRKSEGCFQADESERLLRLGTLFDKAVDVLGKREDAQHWFQMPKKALGGQSPLEYADTELGAREVEDLLGRIAHGVFS